MAIHNGKERLEKIRQAMHKEIDDLLDTPRLIEFAITLEGGVDEALTATVERRSFVGEEEVLFMSNPKNLEKEE